MIKNVAHINVNPLFNVSKQALGETRHIHLLVYQMMNFYLFSTGSDHVE